MHRGTKKYIKCFIFFVIFVSFTLSYSVNLFKVCDNTEFTYFDRPDEINVITRLDKSDREGLFSNGGLTGRTDFIAQSEDETYLDFVTQVNKQYDRYINNQPINGSYSFTYKSQSGGQAMLFACIQNFLPFDNSIQLKIVRLINAMLLAICFIIFLNWVCRNYSLTSSIITFILLLLSPWVTKFGHSIWWALWNFYIPFLIMLIIFERRNRFPERYSDNKIFLAIYVGVFLKCFFSGFEFISTTLICAFCPIFYYLILEKRRLKEIILCFFKNGIAALLGLASAMFVLILQIRSVDGTLMDGINHIVFSYNKRATFEYGGTDIGFGELFKKYLIENSPFSFESVLGIKITFLVVFIVILLSSVLILILQNTWKNKALLLTTLFSLLAPFSWFIIFKQHATTHPFLDYIVWYMPTLILGFVIIGQGVFLTIRKLSIQLKLYRL